MMAKGGSRSKAGGGGGSAAETAEQPQAAPVERDLPNGVSIVEDPDDLFGGNSTTYEFKSGENTLSFKVDQDLVLDSYADAVATFGVNGGFTRQNANTDQARRENLVMAIKAKEIMRYDASRRPDGFIYQVMAHTSDGFGEERTRLYVKAGFSEPNRLGGPQYAIVQNGKLKPWEPPQ